MPVGVYEAEPFCCRTCCEMHHGTFKKGMGSGTNVGRGKPKMFWKEVAA